LSKKRSNEDNRSIRDVLPDGSTRRTRLESAERLGGAQR